jgi:hypothetical protein
MCFQYHCSSDMDIGYILQNQIYQSMYQHYSQDNVTVSRHSEIYLADITDKMMHLFYNYEVTTMNIIENSESFFGDIIFI